MKPTVQLLQVLIFKKTGQSRQIYRPLRPVYCLLYLLLFNSYILYENSYINSHILCEI